MEDGGWVMEERDLLVLRGLRMDLVTSARGFGPDNHSAGRHLEAGREISNKVSRTHHSQCFFPCREDASRCREKQSR